MAAGLQPQRSATSSTGRRVDSGSLVLHFHFPDAADSLADQIVGARHDRACGVLRYEEMATGQRHELGRPMPVHVLVRNRQSGAVVVDKAVETLCLRSRGGEPGFVKTRTVTTLPLAVGTYTIELRNLAGQAGLEDVPTTVSLVPGAK